MVVQKIIMPFHCRQAPHAFCVALYCLCYILFIARSTSEDHNPTLFTPLSKPGEPGSSASTQYKKPYSGWPECSGQCFAGRCILKDYQRGCCRLADPTLHKGRHDTAYVSEANGQHYEGRGGWDYRGDRHDDDDDDDKLVCGASGHNS